MTKVKNKLCIFAAFLLGASQIFALDASARVVLTGNFAEATKKTGEDAKYEFFKLNEKPQKDDDGITIEVSGGNFGGRLGFWYNVDANTAEGTATSFRRSNLWIKPLENLKITAGYVGTDRLYKERIDEWKVGNPFSLEERDWSKHPGYINNADADEMGFGIDYQPIDPLFLTAAVSRRWGSPGAFGKPFWKHDEDGKNTWDAWGVSARYYWRDGICFQAGYRDNGKEDWKVARAAIGIEKSNIYAFVQPCFGIDYNSIDDKYELTGICYDLYGEYRYDSLKFIAHVPFTNRINRSKTTDPSYLEYVVQVLYNTGVHGNMQDLSPYIKVGSMNHDGDNKLAYYRFNDDFKDSLNLDITPGVNFKVGALEMDIGFEILVHSKLYVDANSCTKTEWRVPFSAEIKF